MADQANVATDVAPGVAHVRAPSWGVVLACAAVAVWVSAAHLLAAPRRVVPRRRARYVGAHTRGRVAA